LARPQYVYAIWDDVCEYYIGFFTVKHEAITALTRLISQDGGPRYPQDQLKLHRYPDGRVAHGGECLAW